MSSQYEKRKAKDKIEELKNKVESRAYTNKAYDVYQDGNEYKLSIIEYNPETKVAKISNIKSIDRKLAMIFIQKKNSIKSLVKDN